MAWIRHGKHACLYGHDAYASDREADQAAEQEISFSTEEVERFPKAAASAVTPVSVSPTLKIHGRREIEVPSMLIDC